MKDNINLNEETSQSQESKILDYLLRGNRITGMDALQMFACFRLPARIADIEKRGYKIQSQFVTTQTGKRVKQYWI